MRTRVALAGALALLAAACTEEPPPPPSGPVSPPVESFESIPDAPVSGTLRGAPFSLRDARYSVDRRMAYAHTDVKLSAGAAESPCGEIKPRGAASVWLRLSGAGAVERGQMKLDPKTPAPWSVHYQAREDDRWLGSGSGVALFEIKSIGADGKINGELAVCFADGKKSCVKGSFAAQPCPISIDEPVRGTFPVEDIEGHLPKPRAVEGADAGAADAGARDAGAR